MAYAIHEERCVRRRCMDYIVDDALHHRQQFAPTRKGMDVPSKALSEDTISAFGPSVSGWSEVDIFKRVPSVLNTER